MHKKPDAPARVLIVDDDPGTIRLLGKIIEDFGDIFFATSGAEALAMVRERQPDLMLLDAEMPDMTGFEVCETIKRDPIFADLPILFVSAHTDMESETKALELGAVDFISKPPSPPVVRARVRTHLNLKLRTDQLHRLASVDGLTGIANRRSFDTTLEEEWRRTCRAKTPLCLLLIDVDHFKRYNDHYGHQAGDQCLRTIAAALAGCLHRPGDLLARYGGEEFAAVLPACSLDDAAKLAEKMRQAVAALHLPHAASETGAEVSISLGAATLSLGCQTKGSDYPTWSGACPDSQDCHGGIAALIAAADAGLYRAKAAGRNRVVLAASAA
ncbi:diguanylate cyclase response regulator [Paramagnetospirillum kuznetsovii]|uniref:diguanylate cyclase n=1 Tax=Paramagnetospirillum kuznetsovii TaxID=2053833 RepID=A0A364NZC5_9PROT|nr:diguanylate cyclase [Paramagnetospirillum kuznetsovii]RAU22393.1 diguanylate cyclase response regulator [Paramagnetospirillum kuznetsovii]